MRLFLIRTGGALLTLALVVGTARAQTVDEEPVGRLTIGPQVGILFPGMGDINDNLHVANRFLANDEVRGLDNVNTALVTGLDVRYRLTDRFSIGANWGAVNARSEFDVTRVSARFYSRATTYQFSGYYHFPFATRIDERMQFFAGGGLLLLRAGTVEWGLQPNQANRGSFHPEGDLAELSGRGKASGSATGFSVAGGGSYQLSSRFSLALDFGYRVAKMSDLTIDPNDVEGYYERFGTADENTTTREPGDWAIWDFFLRDPNATLPDGRKRTDPKVPGSDPTGCDTCPLYYDGGNIEVDFSGFFASVYLRVHF